MAAMIIQTKWRKYWRKKNNVLSESMVSVSVVSYQQRGKERGGESANHKKSSFYQPPDTARTDRVLIDIDIEDIDGSISSNSK